MGNEEEDDYLTEILANTSIQQTTLVPEIQLRLFDSESPWSREYSSIFEEGGPSPYWAFAWGSGQSTARYLLDNPELVDGRTVFDFGAGSGVASIAAALAGANRVVANEIDPRALAAVQMNAELNQVNVEVCSFNVFEEGIYGYDVLLASDSFFHWPGNEGLIYSNHDLKTILFAIPNRRGLARGRDLPLQQLTELAKYDVRTVPEIEMEHIKSSTVYEFHP